jgi:multicomponent Na+:H+ antiporter subunit E
MRSIGYVVGLAVIWVLLWGSASPANVLSGVLLGTLLVVAFPGLRRRSASAEHYAFRPLAIARFVGYVLATTVRSNVELTREVFSPTSSLRTAVVGVPLPGCSDELLTLISNLLALSPGTMPLELRQGPTVLYVHVLHLRDLDEVRRDILRLTDLTVRAFASDEVIAAQDAYMEAHRP